MLWVDENGPFRADRALPRASLEPGLDRRIQIPWTELLAASDRDILTKIFANCPWCLDGADVPQ